MPARFPTVKHKGRSTDAGDASHGRRAAGSVEPDRCQPLPRRDWRANITARQTFLLAAT